jgi:hypothetical protein
VCRSLYRACVVSDESFFPVLRFTRFGVCVWPLLCRAVACTKDFTSCHCGLAPSIAIMTLLFSVTPTMSPSQLQELLEDTERREKEVLLKRRALEMLPSARDNIGTWSSVVHAVMRVRRHLLVGLFRCPRAITSAVGIDAWLCSWWWLLWCVCV